MEVLAVLVGGAIGAWLRYLIGLRLESGMYLWSPVLWANVIGCFVFGFFAIYCRTHPSELVKLFVLTGICGALTTFSSYLYEAIQSGGLGAASLVLAMQMVCGFAAMGMGLLLGRVVV